MRLQRLQLSRCVPHIISLLIFQSSATPFNAFGPRQSARVVIPTIITQLLSNKKLNLGNINTKKDFNFIEDIISE